MCLSDLTTQQKKLYVNILVDIVGGYETTYTADSWLDGYIEMGPEGFFSVLTATSEQQAEALRRTLRIIPNPPSP